jgi:hypothetical protein
MMRHSEALAKGHNPNDKATTLLKTAIRRVERDLFAERRAVLVPRESINLE